MNRQRVDIINDLNTIGELPAQGGLSTLERKKNREIVVHVAVIVEQYEYALGILLSFFA